MRSSLMLSRRGISIALLLATGLLAQAPVDRLPDTLLRHEDCQTALPGAESRSGSGGSTRRDGNGRARQAPRESSVGSSSPLRPSWFALDLATPLLWCVVIIALVFVLAVVVRSWRGRPVREPAPAAVVRARSQAPEVAAAVELADHERLAQAGDFAAAVQALLRAAIASWVARGGAAPLHLTARELLRRVRAQAVPVEDLAQLVGVVERVHFGGWPADRAVYDASRGHLQQWEGACRTPK